MSVLWYCYNASTLPIEVDMNQIPQLDLQELSPANIKEVLIQNCSLTLHLTCC